MDAYVNLFIKAVFVENLALAFFLGMCTFLAVSKRVETALGLGLALTGTLTPLATAILMPVSSLTIVGLSVGLMRRRTREVLA